MKLWRVTLFMTILGCLMTTGLASDPKLDGAYKFVSLKFPGGERDESSAKGLIVVHGRHMAFVQSNVDRKTWDQKEPEADRIKKMAEAFDGLRATAGSFQVQGNMIVLDQLAQANPGSMGKPSKWEFKIEGNRLILRPEGIQNVIFTFERLQ